MEAPKLIGKEVGVGPWVRIENRRRRLDLHEAEAGLRDTIAHLAPEAEAVFVRVPLIDPFCPKTSDLDVLVFGSVDELIPQRLRILMEQRPPLMVDIIWLPAASLDDPETFASNGVVPHRLLNSRLVSDKTGYAARQCEAVRRLMYRNDIQLSRISGFLDLGFYAVREIGVTRDFPGLALFWLHMAYAACLAALCDGIRLLCPNVYTRPFDWIRHIEAQYDLRLEASFIRCLHLEADPSTLIAPLRRIHRTVARRFPEPDWLPSMRSSTRYEYRYFLDEDELEWRISVSRELAASQNPAASIFYLRFWSYTLCRIPMVSRCAREGRDVSFMRPERAVRPALETDCPEILDDLAAILSGSTPVDAADVKSSVNTVLEFHKLTLALLGTRGLEMKGLRDWQPFDPPR